MKAWRFYGFNDMRLDEVPDPVRREGHVIAEILCVQPSVTEAQLAYGIPTLAYEQIKHRLETEAPIRLFGHEFCARIVESDGDSQFRPGDRVAARAKLPAVNAPFAYRNVGTTAVGDRLSAFSCPAVSPSSPSCPKSL